MTIASECILAGELGIPYAAVCVVDNLANGVAAEPLSVEEFEAGKAANRDAADRGDRRRRRRARRTAESDERSRSRAPCSTASVVGLRTAEDGTIAALGPDVRAEPGDEVIDGAGMALVPGLVNGHTHAAMTLFRGYADDLPLMEWLEGHIWPAEAKLDAEDVYWGTRLACARDDPHRDRPLLGHVLAARRDRAGGRRRRPAGDDRRAADRRAARGEPRGSEAAPRRRRSRELAGSPGLDPPSLAPHAIYTVSEESLRWIGEESERLGIPIQIHISETEGEVDDCLAAHGVRPVELLDRLGMLGAADAARARRLARRARARADRRRAARRSSPTPSPT